MCVNVPGKVVALHDEGGQPFAQVDISGTLRRISLSLLPEVAVGDHVVTHSGFALAVIDAAEAEETLHLMREAGLLGTAGDGV